MGPLSKTGVLPFGQGNPVAVFLPARQVALDDVARFKNGDSLAGAIACSRRRLLLQLCRRSRGLRLWLSNERRQKQESQTQNLAEKAEHERWWS